MVAILARAPAGFAGAVSRSDSLTIETNTMDPNTPPTAFGQFVKLVSGLIQPLASGDAAGVIYGLSVRAYPVQSTTNAFGAAAPSVPGNIGVLRRGYMAVNLKLGTAAKGGTVYVVTTAGGSVAVGDIVTAASPAGGGTAVAANAVFEGPADASGVVEISFNI